MARRGAAALLSLCHDGHPCLRMKSLNLVKIENLKNRQHGEEAKGLQDCTVSAPFPAFPAIPTVAAAVERHPSKKKKRASNTRDPSELQNSKLAHFSGPFFEFNFNRFHSFGCRGGSCLRSLPACCLHGCVPKLIKNLNPFNTQLLTT